MPSNNNLSMLPWKLSLGLSFFSFVMKLCCRPDGTVNRRLFRWFDGKTPASDTPVDGVTSFDTVVDVSRSLWFRVYTPSVTQTLQANVRLPAVVYFHGGGFVFYTADSAAVDTLCRRFAKELNAVVFSVNYRLAPERRFPCQYQDGFDALKFIDKIFSDGLAEICEPKRCFLAGESAGGNLAHHVAVKAGQYKFRCLNVVGLISIQPFFGGEERTESEKRLAKGPVLSLVLTDRFWKAFLPEGSDRDHPAANVSGAKAMDISNTRFPETLLVVGGLDPLQDRQRGYSEWLKEAGKEVKLVEYPSAFHGFSGVSNLPETSLFLEEVWEFIGKASEVLKTDSKYACHNIPAVCCS